MGRKSQHKEVSKEDDLEQRVNVTHAQREKEKAFYDLIVKIIVNATMREYYETLEQQNNSDI